MKIKISKKNILEKGSCGGDAPARIDISSAADSLDGMSPQEAYNMGYNEAVAEIMNMVSEMMHGGIPIDMPVPVDIAHMDQLE